MPRGRMRVLRCLMAPSLVPVGCGLLALVVGACSSSQPPTLPSLAPSTPPAADAAPGTPPKPGSPPVSLGSNAGQPAKEPTVAAGGLGQITAIRTATVVLYSSDDGTDGQRVPASTLGLPMPVAGRTPKRLAIHTVEGVRWIAIADVTYAAPQATAKAKP